MYVWEILFLIIYSLFALRELHQLFSSRIFPCVRNLFTTNTPVHPDKTDEDANDGGLELEKRGDVGGNTDEVPVVEPKHVAEKYVEDKDSNELQDIEGGTVSAQGSVSTPPPRGKIMTDFNNDGRDDLEQLESFMHDLNDNGIDDAEELMEFVDELLPDAAGMLDILDWVTIGIMSLAIYYRVDYIYKTADLHEFFIDLAEEMNYHESMTEIITRFTEIDENLSIMNTLVMFLVFFGIVQFFRYLSFDRRLGIVTATIKESLGSLLPVLLIFMVVMFAYSVLGTVMYGAHLNDWSNIGKSMSQLFLLILGEFGTYFDIMQINPHLSAIFFWSYITMALFLLFNMVLAVIFTVYDEQNTEIRAMEAVEKEEEEYEKKMERTEKESKKDK